MFGLQPERSRRIFALAVPIMLGMMSQTLLNVVDTLMVSQLGADAIAAVGFGGFMNFLCTAFVTGMSAGVQAVASRRVGEGRGDESAVALNGGLVLVVLIAVPLSAIMITVAPHLFALVSTDADVVAIGVPYLQVRLLGMVTVGANFAFRGYWNGVDKSRLYLQTIVVMHVANVAISYVLIFGALGAPELGATGAGIGTAVSTLVGTAYYFFLGMKHARGSGFLSGIPPRKELVSMLRLSFPAGLQSMLYAAGLTTMFAIVDRIGTNEVAAMNVLINISMVAFLPGLGLGLTSATLVGQALGRKDIDDAERWGWDVVRAGVQIMFVLGLPMAIAPELLLSAFLSKEPEALALAIVPLRLAGLTVWLEAVLMVLLNSIMGAGATKLGLIVNVGMQWGLFLPCAVLIGPVLGGGLLSVWMARIGYRGLQALTLAILWRRRRWASIDV